MKISASFLGANNPADVIRKLSATDVDYIHLDVMDGKYVKNKTLTFNEFKTIHHYTSKRLDVHLMVQNPLKMIDDYASLNVEFLTVHLDTKSNLEKIFLKCASYGIKIGLALNPKDQPEAVFPYLDQISLVLVMGVTPGFSGQTFIPETFLKIKALKKEIQKRHLKTLISVDGGVNFLNIHDLRDVDIVVSGSTIINSTNYQETITKLRG